MTRKLLTSIAFTLLAPGLLAAQTQRAPAPPQAPAPVTLAAVAPDPPPSPGPPQAYRDGGGVFVTARRDGAVIIRRQPGMFMAGQEMGMVGGPDMGMRGPRPGDWWNRPGLVKRLGLSDDQVAKIKKIFLDHRLQLIDLHANLEKQEVLLQPMIDADHPDENAVLAQIDKIADARASLEKSDARMLFAIRGTLTPEQWQKLRQIRSEMRRPRPMARRAFRGRMEQRGGMMMRRSGNSNGPAAAPGPPPAPQDNGGSQQQ